MSRDTATAPDHHGERKGPAVPPDSKAAPSPDPITSFPCSSQQHGPSLTSTPGLRATLDPVPGKAALATTSPHPPHGSFGHAGGLAGRQTRSGLILIEPQSAWTTRLCTCLLPWHPIYGVGPPAYTREQPPSIRASRATRRQQQRSQQQDSRVHAQSTLDPSPNPTKQLGRTCMFRTAPMHPRAPRSPSRAQTHTVYTRGRPAGHQGGTGRTKLPPAAGGASQLATRATDAGLATLIPHWPTAHRRGLAGPLPQGLACMHAAARPSGSTTQGSGSKRPRPARCRHMRVHEPDLPRAPDPTAYEPSYQAGA